MRMRDLAPNDAIISMLLEVLCRMHKVMELLNHFPIFFEMNRYVFMLIPIPCNTRKYCSILQFNDIRFNSVHCSGYVCLFQSLILMQISNRELN